MTDSNYTHIKVIVDRSGSMGWPIEAPVSKEMVTALNALFEEQAKLDGKCLVDYVQFDTFYESVYENRPVSEATAVISPRGGTALVDAIGQGTVEFGAKLRAMREDDRPGTVLVVVVTDGQENSSMEYTSDQVKALVEEQRGKYNWDYLFLGANIDAVKTGKAYGFAPGSSLTYDTRNTGQTVAMASAYTSTVRSKGAGNAEFSEEDRKKAVDTNSK